MNRSYLPLFPLNMVAFPGQKLNLHIFEERYKQLINDCVSGHHSFGIPAYINSKMNFGTEMSLEKVAKKYADGTMDIVSRGQKAFKIISFENPAKNKLYAGGTVEYLDNVMDKAQEVQEEFVGLLKEFFGILSLINEVNVADHVTSFEMGHKVGLSEEEEYDLLQMEEESSRQEFLIQHLKKAIPILKQVEETKEFIRMNGHFRNIGPLEF